MRLEPGTRVLITGASRGIGAALARRLAARGCVLGLVARGEEGLRELVASLPGEGHRALPADVAERDSIRAAVAAFGDVDVVVRDSGAGVPPGMEREIFRRGVSTKDIPAEGPDGPGRGAARERGIGLSLVHLVCTRRGGNVTVSSVGGSTFTATLPVENSLVTS